MDLDIPNASAALEEATRPRRPRTAPRAYERAMATVLSAISRAVRSGMTSTVVEVPTFVFGLARVYVDDVTAYVRDTLVQHGYRVDTFPGSPYIAIDWGRGRANCSGVPSLPRNDVSRGVVADRTTDDPFDIGL